MKSKAEQYFKEARSKMIVKTSCHDRPKRWKMKALGYKRDAECRLSMSSNKGQEQDASIKRINTQKEITGKRIMKAIFKMTQKPQKSLQLKQRYSRIITVEI